MATQLKELTSLVDSLFRDPDLQDDNDYDAHVISTDDNRAVLSEFPIELGETIESLSVINHVVDLQQQTPTALSGKTRTFFASGTPGARATMFAYRAPNTGGHHHGGRTRNTNAVGVFSPTEITFGDNYPQDIPITYTLPDVSGSVYAGFISSDRNDAAGIITITFSEGFVLLSASNNLRLKAPTKTHPSPYWVTPAMRSALNKLANGYAARTKKYITITDASLEHGGLFDYKATWLPPHQLHRDGQTVDIRNRDQNRQQREIFVEEARKSGITPSDHGNHWHVRLS